MYLVAAETVDDLTACVLQPVRHFNVVGLIEAGPELHQHHHLFAVFCGVTEGIHDLRMACHTIEGDLDGLHSLILGRIPEHADKALHALEGIGQQHILPLDLIQDRLSLHQGR